MQNPPFKKEKETKKEDKDEEERRRKKKEGEKNIWLPLTTDKLEINL